MEYYATDRTCGEGCKIAEKAASQPSEKSDASRKIDEKIADLGDWRGERLSEIRRIIREVEPEDRRRMEVDGVPHVVARRGNRCRQRP